MYRKEVPLGPQQQRKQYQQPHENVSLEHLLLVRLTESTRICEYYVKEIMDQCFPKDGRPNIMQSIDKDM